MLIVTKMFFCSNGLIMSPLFVSGRRDFGDFSVYNPAKKACDTTEMDKA